jgi:hypothetical protein
MTWTSTRLTPGVEIGPAEVELAARAVLLGQDGALRGELAQCVSVNPEIVGGMAGVEPVVPDVVVGGCFACEAFGDFVCQLVDERWLRWMSSSASAAGTILNVVLAVLSVVRRASAPVTASVGNAELRIQTAGTRISNGIWSGGFQEASIGLECRP